MPTTTSSIIALVGSLADVARSFDGPRELGFMADRLVPGPAGQPIFDPYIALVGPDYVSGRSALVLATAQNLAQFIGRWDTPKAVSAIGRPGETLWRLHGGAPTVEHRPFSQVPIQPWADGVLVALAGVLALARGEAAPESLDEIARGTAVTNFFKHSLRGEGRRDLNPLNGGVVLQGWSNEIAADYLERTLAGLVVPELQILRPRDIITFKHLPAAKLRAVSRATVWVVNDPAWIKRGMGGAAKKPAWHATAEGLSKEVAGRIDGWIRQMLAPYSAGKAAATRLYLAKYYREFEAALSRRA